MGTSYYYQTFGLTFHSEIALSFPEIPPQDAVDVHIRLGDVESQLDTASEKFGLWETAPNEFLFKEENTCRIFVKDGCEMTVQPTPGVDMFDVSIFVVGSGMAGLLIQRGILPLHSSVISTPKGAVLICGDSGAGKSTTAACLAKKGYPTLADDIAAIEIDGAGQPVVTQATSYPRLWQDSVDALDLNDRDKLPISSKYGKFMFPAPLAAMDKHPIRAIYLLSHGDVDEPTFETLEKTDAFERLTKATYRGRLLQGLGKAKLRFQTCLSLAHAAPVIKLTRTDERGVFHDLSAAILENLDQHCDG